MSLPKRSPKVKQHLRRAVDGLMALLLPLLMAYELIGAATHEVIGITMAIVLIVHHVLNRAWYAHLFKGRYNALRWTLTLLDLVLLVILAAQAVSGIMMAKHTFEFLLHVGRRSTARVIHMLGAYWGFTLMSVHAGMHMRGLLSKLFSGSVKRKAGALLFTVLLVCYGLYAFIHRGLPGYLSGQTQFAFFDFEEPLVFFLLDYIAMMVMFMLLGGGLVTMLKQGRRRLKSKDAQSSMP